MEKNNRHNRKHHWNNKNQNKNSPQPQEKQVKSPEKKYHFVAHEDLEARKRKENAIIELKKREVICPLCGEKIADVASAIADKNTGNPVHFECVMNKLSETEKCGQNEKICYIGQGRFGILYFENPRDQRHFEIRKIIEWESREQTRQWRDEMSGLYSQVE